MAGDEELNRAKPSEFPADPVSGDLAAAKDDRRKKEGKAEAEARKRSAKPEAEKCSVGSCLLSIFMISGVVFAAVGVAIFVTKKLKEK